MKLKSLILTVSIGVSMTSCESEDLMYSCDKNVDLWVKDHIKEIREMSRETWLEADAEFALPMYRAFTFEQRKNFWKEKFSELKQLSWSEAEKKHIMVAETFLFSNLYILERNQLTSDQLDTVELFLYQWKDKAKEELGWSDLLISSIIASGEKVVDTKGTIVPLKSKVGSIVLSSSESCNCHVKSIFTCDQYTECKDVNCTGTSYGCGGFLVWPCNGICEDF